MAEPKTPWLYPFREDPQQTRLGQPVFRPSESSMWSTTAAPTGLLCSLIGLTYAASETMKPTCTPKGSASAESVA